VKRSSISIYLSLILLIGLSPLSGCQRSLPNQSKSQKPVVAVSIDPQKTFVEAVCGELAEVIVMVPPGSSPANYEPSPKEMERFHQADLFFAIGVPTETANLLPTARTLPRLKIIQLHEETALQYPDLEIAPGQRDPHIWLSPKRAMAMVEIIAREMILQDPSSQETYEQNAQSYILELQQLDQEIRELLQAIENRQFIVFHPAFAYFAHDYDLTMHPLEQDGKEATPQRLKEMIDLARKENIKVLFYQAEISSRQAQSFAEEIGGKTLQLAPLAPNYIENLRNMATLMTEVMHYSTP